MQRIQLLKSTMYIYRKPPLQIIEGISAHITNSIPNYTNKKEAERNKIPLCPSVYPSIEGLMKNLNHTTNLDFE